ncbi:MAG: lysostaphin resistance A-like protein [Ilumatobacter sp.]
MPSTSEPLMSVVTPPPPGAPWPPPSTPMGVAFSAPKDEHPTLPFAAGLGALVVLTVSLLCSKLLLDLVVDYEWPVVFYVMLLGASGYGPSVCWWLFATKQWGSGSRFGDVGIEPRWSDLAWGPLIWFSTLMVQAAISVLVLVLNIPIANNTDDIGEFSADRTYTIAIVITAVVAAPLVEELVFRGLVMRSLLSVAGAPVAIILQGVLFGVAHIDPVRGVGNVGLAVVLSGVGISFGAAAYWLRRIGPTMVAHAIFNGVVMIILLTGIRDRILENNPDPFDQSASVAELTLEHVTLEHVTVVDQADIAEPHRSGDSHSTR